MAVSNSKLVRLVKPISDNTALDLSTLGFAMLKRVLLVQHRQRMLGCDGCLNIEHTLLLGFWHEPGLNALLVFTVLILTLFALYDQHVLLVGKDAFMAISWIPSLADLIIPNLNLAARF